MPPIKFPIKRIELEGMKVFQVRNHRKWPAAFSTNADYKIWPFTHFGKTPRNRKVYVQGELAVIDRIAEAYRGERPSGGRFFISDVGAFYTDEYSEENQFIEFEFLD
jgi:hypothetical protein